MNKKLFAALSTAGVAVSFWACGSGEIYEPSVDDESVKISVTDPSAAIYLCDPYQIECTPLVDQSSAAEEISSSSKARSSSSAITHELPTFFSSSSAFVIGGGESSAGGGTPAAGTYGTCEPSAAVVDKITGTVSYTFKPITTGNGHTVNDFLTKAAYKWDLGANATVKTSSTSKFSSDVVVYSTSGPVTPTVTVSFDGTQPQVISCGKVQVNGDPITGCTCTTDASGAVDFTATPDVTWSVTGCKSSSAVNSYAWAGGAAGASPSYTKTFTAATASFAPTLKVGNSDNTVIDVTCPAVKVTEGAEYEIKKSQDEVELPGAGTYAVVISGGSSLTACRISCNAKGDLTAKVNGKTFTGSYYVNFEGIDTSWCNKTLDFNVSAAATCQASWN